MNETIDDKISQFTSSTILKMHSEGWFNSELRNFDLVVLNSLTDLQHINLDELPLNQLQYIVERAAQSLPVYEVLQGFIYEAFRDGEYFPDAISDFCIQVVSGHICPPKKSRNSKNDIKDFTLLLLSEVISKKFQITTSRNDHSCSRCAFDYVIEALYTLHQQGAVERHITTTFNSLSRMQSNKPHVAEQVQQCLNLFTAKV